MADRRQIERHCGKHPEYNRGYAAGVAAERERVRAEVEKLIDPKTLGHEREHVSVTLDRVLDLLTDPEPCETCDKPAEDCAGKGCE